MVIISSALLVLAYRFPETCGWFSLFFLVPVLYAFEIKSGKNLQVLFLFTYGFLWGLLFFSAHWWSNIGHLLFTHAQFPHGHLAFFCLVVYCAVHAGFWWVLSRWMPFICAAFLYFVWMRYGVFWIFGIHGYPFAWPLLPLAHDARWLSALFYLKEEGLLCVVLCMQFFLVRALTRKDISACFCACICMIPFFIGWIVPQKSIVMQKTVCAPVITNCSTQYLLDRAEEIYESIVETRCNAPEVSILLFPESTYPWALNDDEDIVRMWTSHALSDAAILLIGAYYHDHEQGCLYNGVYVITRDGIRQFCAKSSLVPFFECVPWPWGNFVWCRNLFLHMRQGFRAGCKRKVLAVSSDFSCILSVCADLFLGVRCADHSLPQVCLVNEDWFQDPTLKDGMFFFARCRAMLWRREIFYVGYHKKAWIGPQGETVDL